MKKTIITAVLIVFCMMDIHAQDTTDRQNITSGYLSPINVEGEFKRRQDYEGSLDSKLNRQNKKRNRLIKKRIERKQLDLGNIITQKLNKALEGRVAMGEDDDEENFNGISKISKKNFRPAASIVLEKTPNFDDFSSKNTDQVEIIPYMGAMSISGDNLDLDSRLSFGIVVESRLNKKARLGLDFNYSELKIEPLDQNNAALQQRNIDYRRLGLDIAAKVSLFDIDSSKINPFVGVSVGYSNSNLDYAYLSHLDPFVSNAFVASAMVGTEISFNKQVGINLAVKFSRGLTESSDTTNQTNSNNNDINRLNSIGRSIEDADYTSFNGGLVLKF